MRPMNPSLEIEPHVTRRRFGRVFWMMIAVITLWVVWTVGARPAGGFVTAQEPPPAPQIDDGLTDEEREFINRPISDLTPEERKRRDEILEKMKNHLIMAM